jgi:chromosome segregation ATPase
MATEVFDAGGALQALMCEMWKEDDDNAEKELAKVKRQVEERDSDIERLRVELLKYAVKLGNKTRELKAEKIERRGLAQELEDVKRELADEITAHATTREECEANDRALVELANILVEEKEAMKELRMRIETGRHDCKGDVTVFQQKCDEIMARLMIATTAARDLRVLGDMHRFILLDKKTRHTTRALLNKWTEVETAVAKTFACEKTASAAAYAYMDAIVRENPKASEGTKKLLLERSAIL